MDLFAMLTMVAIPAGILLIYSMRGPAISQEIESLEVAKNLGTQETPKREGFLAWAYPTAVPFVVTEGTGPVVENVLIFEEYPLIPLRVRSQWIAPGTALDVLILKDAEGRVLDIRLAP